MSSNQPPPPPGASVKSVEPEGRPSGRPPADRQGFQVKVKPEIFEMLEAASVDMRNISHQEVAAMVLTPANIKDVRDRFVEQFG